MRLLRQWMNALRRWRDRPRRRRRVRVGFTIGLDHIVAVEVRGGLTGPRVGQVQTRPLRSPADDGTWPDLTDALREVTEAMGVRIAAASVALRRPIARAKVLAVPRLGRRDARALLTRNIRRYFVVGSEPVEADATWLRRGKRGETGPALAVCADRRRIEMIEQCFAAAGLTVDGLTAAAVALTHAVCRSLTAARRGATVIAVDTAGWSEGIALCDGRPTGLQPWGQPAAGVGELVQELQRCAAAVTEPRTSGVTGIVVASADRRVRVTEAVAAATGHAPIEWAGVGYLEPDAVAALGAALVPERAPLLLTEAARRVRRRRIGSRIAMLGTAAALLLAVSAGLYRLDLARELRQVALAREGMASEVAAALRLRRSVTGVQERLKAIAEAEQTEIDWTPALAALAQALPDSAYLLSLTADGIEIRLAGVANAASSVVPALEASPLLGNVSLTTARRADGGVDAERFDVALFLDPPSIGRSRARPGGAQ